MTDNVIDFYTHWKKNQEKKRKAIGFPADLWYNMLDNGYEPTNVKDVEQFLEEEHVY